MNKGYKTPVDTKTGYSTPDWIVSDNRIKTRYYNLVIDGEIVEEYLTSRMANILRDVYREEGMAVDKVEAYSLTNSGKIVGENAAVNRSDDPQPNKGFLTPAATKNKIQRDRNTQRARNNARVSAKTTTIAYRSYGRDKNSILHQEYLANLRKSGYRVYNKLNDQVWLGTQKEIAERIYNYLNRGGKKSDLDIKFLGAK